MKQRMIAAAFGLFCTPAWVVASNTVEARNCPPDMSAPFSFAVIADTPYSLIELAGFPALTDDINADPDVRFVMHGGDIKSGRSDCSDAVLAGRFRLFQRFEMPFIFSPGDNEWTDCHRSESGGWNPLERLRFVRQLFFPRPGQTTGECAMPVRSQATEPDRAFAEFSENVMFSGGGILFSAIHVVGSKNGLKPWSGIDGSDSKENPRADRLAEFKRRQQAAVAWLHKSFDSAELNNHPGIVILIHADLEFGADFNSGSRAGFNRFLAALSNRSQQFARPVLLIHGDSHQFVLDNPPLTPWESDGVQIVPVNNGTSIRNVTRLQTFGQVSSKWLKVTVDVESDQLFSIRKQTVGPPQ